MTKEIDYFKAFCKVSRAFGTTLDKDELLRLITQSAVESMNGKASCLFLADRKEDVFVPVAQYGLSDDYLHAKPMRAKRLVEEIADGGYLYFKDAASDPRLENHEAKKAEGIASILTVPVRVSDNTIGVLSLYSGESREFSDIEIEFLAALAEQGGVAIENARLIRRIRQNADLYSDLAATINSSLDIKKILHILTSDIAEAFNMQGVAVRLLNKAGGTLDLVASYGLSEDYLTKGPVTAETHVKRALRGEIVAIPNTTEDPELKYREATLREGIGSMLIVPITAGEEVIGIMRLCSAYQRGFPEDLIQLVGAVAKQGGLAIQNASMYLMLEQDKRSLEEDIWSHKSWF